MLILAVSIAAVIHGRAWLQLSPTGACMLPSRRRSWMVCRQATASGIDAGPSTSDSGIDTGTLYKPSPAERLDA